MDEATTLPHPIVSVSPLALCTKCKRYKDHQQFPRNRSRASGIGHYCKSCQYGMKKLKARRLMGESTPRPRRWEVRDLPPSGA